MHTLLLLPRLAGRVLQHSCRQHDFHLQVFGRSVDLRVSCPLRSTPEFRDASPHRAAAVACHEACHGCLSFASRCTIYVTHRPGFLSAQVFWSKALNCHYTRIQGLQPVSGTRTPASSCLAFCLLFRSVQRRALPDTLLMHHFLLIVQSPHLLVALQS